MVQELALCRRARAAENYEGAQYARPVLPPVIVSPPSTPASLDVVQASPGSPVQGVVVEQAGRQSCLPPDRRAQAASAGQGWVLSQAMVHIPSAPTSAQSPVVQAPSCSTPFASRQESPKSFAAPSGRQPRDPGGAVRPAGNLLADVARRARRAARAVGQAEGRRGAAVGGVGPSAMSAQTAPVPQNPVAQVVEQMPREKAGPHPEPTWQRHCKPGTH